MTVTGPITIGAVQSKFAPPALTLVARCRTTTSLPRTVRTVRTVIQRPHWASFIINLGPKGVYAANQVCDDDTHGEWGSDAALN